MLRRLGLAAVLLLLPPAVRAEHPPPAPEAFLAEHSLFYLRFDGLEPHGAAFERTALAELLRGDAGGLVDYAARLVREQLGEKVVKDKLLKGVTPDQLLRHQALVRQLPRLLDVLKRHGFVLGG